MTGQAPGEFSAHETHRSMAKLYVSLTDLYEALPAALTADLEPFDVEAGLADLNRWIDTQEAKEIP